MKFGLIGGTGPQGRGIALRLAKKHHHVVIGSRSAEKAQKIANELNVIIESDYITGDENINIINHSEILFLTIPYETITDTLSPLLEMIKQHTKIFIDVTVPLKFEKGKGMVYVELEEGSSAQLVQKLVDPVPVVGALKTLSAHKLLEINTPLDRDTFIFGNKNSREEIIKIFNDFSDLRPINAGPLSVADTIERLVPFLINLNRRYKIKDSGIRMVL